MNVRTIIAATLIVFSLLFSSAASAGATVSGKQPFSGTVNVCEDSVFVEGWTQTVGNIVDDGAGGSHMVMTTNVRATGVDSWGTRYQWIDTFQNVGVANSAGGYEATSMQGTHLISQGPVNFHLWMDFHVTITPADGTLIVDWDIWQHACI